MPPFEHATVQVGGLRTHYLTAGTGYPVVLIHGDGADAADWSWILPGLAQRYRVYALDLPGSGGTPPSPIGYTPEILTQFLASFLDAVDLERAVLVGHSAGGLLALLHALDQPYRVPALVALDSSGLGRFVNPALAAQAVPGVGRALDVWAKNPVGSLHITTMRALLQFANPALVPLGWVREQMSLDRSPGFFEATAGIVRDNLCFGMQRVVVLDRLPELSMPVQLLWGDLDLVVPIYQAFNAVRRLGNGRLDVISGAGHMPHVERPEQLLAALMPFLERAVS